MMSDAEYLAKMFHYYYEELAPGFGYQTREESAVSWNEVPTQNKQLMIAVAEKLLDGHVLIIEKRGKTLGFRQKEISLGMSQTKPMELLVVNLCTKELRG